MKLIAIILTALATLALGGCATGQYEAYAAAQTATAQARHQAEAERYKALAAIAMSGSDTARVAAVMSLSGLGGLGGGGAQAAPGPAIAAPRSPGDTALQWASVLLPSVTQLYSIGQQVKLGIHQSDNSTALGVSTNNAFVGLAGKIQAPAANVTTTTNTTTTSTIGANSGANSGNSGRLAGTSITDNTSTPTVVTQPAPVIVRPEVIQPTTPTTP